MWFRCEIRIVSRLRLNQLCYVKKGRWVRKRWGGGLLNRTCVARRLYWVRLNPLDDRDHREGVTVPRLKMGEGVALDRGWHVRNHRTLLGDGHQIGVGGLVVVLLGPGKLDSGCVQILDHEVTDRLGLWTAKRADIVLIWSITQDNLADGVIHLLTTQE